MTKRCTICGERFESEGARKACGPECSAAAERRGGAERWARLKADPDHLVRQREWRRRRLADPTYAARVREQRRQQQRRRRAELRAQNAEAAGQAREEG